MAMVYRDGTSYATRSSISPTKFGAKQLLLPMLRGDWPFFRHHDSTVGAPAVLEVFWDDGLDGVSKKRTQDDILAASKPSVGASVHGAVSGNSVLRMEPIACGRLYLDFRRR